MKKLQTVLYDLYRVYNSSIIMADLSDASSDPYVLTRYDMIASNLLDTPLQLVTLAGSPKAWGLAQEAAKKLGRLPPTHVAIKGQVIYAV